MVLSRRDFFLKNSGSGRRWRWRRGAMPTRIGRGGAEQTEPMMMMMSASLGRGAGGRAQRATGSSTTAPRFNNCVEGSPPCFLSDISGWRDGALYPLARGCRAPRRPATERPARAACWPTSPTLFRECRIGATMAPAPGELSDLRGRRARHPDRDRTEMVPTRPSPNSRGLAFQGQYRRSARAIQLRNECAIDLTCHGPMNVRRGRRPRLFQVRVIHEAFCRIDEMPLHRPLC